ncbi:MAG: hypothetical protein LAT63_05845 [Marinobacter sp.]|nr:hypothetical protein [Marinobacter sp.]
MCAYKRALLITTATLLLLACAAQLPEDWRSLLWVDGQSDTARQADELTVQFLGAGGIFLQYDDQALLGDPFFSNPPLGHWLTLRTLRSQTAVIDQHLPPTDQVRGILVGHGHYDHAMDIPYIARQLAEDARVYGSETVANLMAPELPSHRLMALNTVMAQDRQGGEWVYLSPRLRILPIYSEHSPHFGNTVLASNPIRSPLSDRARSVLAWKGGVNLNYVIDFLTDNSGSVAFRVFYQSSASHGHIGLPPDWLLADGIPFDLAALCAANYDNVDNYPEAILGHINPREVLLIHWEVFWDNYSTEQSTPLPGLDFADLEQRIRRVVGELTPVRVPNRGASYQLGQRPDSP